MRVQGKILQIVACCQEKPMVKFHTSLLWGTGNIGSLRGFQRSNFDVGSESIHGKSGETEPVRLNSTISMGFFWDNTWATTVSMADLVVFAHPFDHSQLPEILRVVFLGHIWNHRQVANSLTVKQLYHAIRISLSSVHEFQNIRTKIFCKLQISIHNCLDLPPT